MGSDYASLDLTPYRDSPASLLDDALTGVQTLRGIPFAIGEADRAFLAPTEPVTIGVGSKAMTVVFAHRLLASELPRGGELGITVAEYVFRFADGTEQRQSIRERFEIAAPLGWGEIPFLAVPDHGDALEPRWAGSWANMGRRQTESVQARVRSYYLWCWRNPRPDVAIESIAIVPRGPRFLIAGVTLGSVDENPFGHNGALPLRIELTDPAIADRNLNGGAAETSGVDVTIDRGIAGYAWTLPGATPEVFLADGMAGWGEAANRSARVTYAEVGGAPSATVTVHSNGEAVASFPWRDIEAGKSLTAPRARIEVIEHGRNWVETVVLDDETGEPIPCRVHFRSVHGVPYQPHGHHGHVNSGLGSWHVDVGGDLWLGQMSYAYIDGRCQGWLPRGEVIVDVARGYEYEPVRQRLTIDPEQRRLELRLKRWSHLNRRGWYSGDTHVHFLSTQGGQREALGEDLNVVNLLLSQWGSLFTNTEEFTGEPLISRDGKTIVWATQENRQHLLGHLTLLGLKRPVYPWCSDGPSEAEMGGTLETTLSAWADACHAQGGTVVLPHLPEPNGEPSTLIATGRVDAVEMLRQDPFFHLEYYRYLNAGYRLPLVGGTDKMSSQVAVGQYRTYVRIPDDEEFGYETWCRNLRLGRTFLSGGPLIAMQIDGRDIGDTIDLPPGGGTVEVVASVGSTIPIHTLQIVLNGEVAAESGDRNGTRKLELHARVRVDRHSWICARASGPEYVGTAHHDVWGRRVFAHTSPIYVAVGGAWEMANPAGLRYMLTLVEGSLQYVRGLAPRRRPGTALHHHGEVDHQAHLERPFLEAQEALHRRLHALGVAH